MFCVHFAPDNQITDEMCQEGKRPADRVGDVERLDRAVPLEDGKDPDDPERTGTDQGDDHRQE